MIFQSALKRFIPLFDRVLVQRLAAETKTSSGIMIPEKAQAKVLQATVIAVGPGGRTDVSIVHIYTSLVVRPECNILLIQKRLHQFNFCVFSLRLALDAKLKFAMISAATLSV